MTFTIEAMTNSVTQQIYDSASSDPTYAIGNPILKLEVSKAGSLSFSILPTHPAYDSFRRMITYITVYQDEEIIFRGRVLDINDSTYMERNITCEGDLAFLNDSLQPPDKNYVINEDLEASNESQRESLPVELQSEMPEETITVVQVPESSDPVTRTVAQQFTTYIQIHNSQMDAEKQLVVGNITVTSKNESVKWDSTSYRSTKSAIDSDLISSYGGYLQVRHENGHSYIDWLKNPGSTSNQTLTLGVNIIDLQKQNKGNDIFTRLVPVGKDHITLDSQEALPYIQDDDLVDEYGAIYKTISYSSVDDKSKLESLAQDYMEDNCKEDPISLTIKAIDMNILDGNIETIHVGQRVNVVSEPHGISVVLNVISIEYDIQNPENNTYEIGDPSETLTQKVESDSSSSSSSSHGSSGSMAGSIGNLEAAANRHAANIVDLVDKSYTLQADEIKVKARVIKVEADLLEIQTDLLYIQTNVLVIDANDYVAIHCDSVDIGSITITDDNGLYIDGSTEMTGDLTMNGSITLPMEETISWYAGSTILDGGRVTSGSFTYTHGNVTNDLENCVISFGNASASAAGVITIPYTTAKGDSGSITFNMASTAFYQNAVEAAWNNGGKTAYVKNVPYISSYGSTTVLQPGEKRAIRAYYVDNDGEVDSIPVAAGNRAIVIPVEAAGSSSPITPSDISITGVTYDPTNYSGVKAQTISSIVHGNSTGYCMFTVSVSGVTKQYYISLAG